MRLPPRNSRKYNKNLLMTNNISKTLVKTAKLFQRIELDRFNLHGRHMLCAARIVCIADGI